MKHTLIGLKCMVLITIIQPYNNSTLSHAMQPTRVSTRATGGRMFREYYSTWIYGNRDIGHETRNE
jgi:hypothetical protein